MSTYLVIFEAVFKDVLNDEAPGFAQGNFMPHSTKRIVDELHDLRGGFSPTKLKQLLPYVARIAVDDSFRNSSQQFVYHDRLVLFGNRIKRFLNNVAAERIHGKIQGISTYSLCNLDHLLWSSMLKATLNKEITEAVYHQGVSLGHNSLNDLVLLFRGANLQFLLKKNGSLLVIVADNLVDNVLPITVDIAIQQTTIVEWLCWRQIGRVVSHNGTL